MIDCDINLLLKLARRKSELVKEFHDRLDARSQAHREGYPPPINLDLGHGSKSWLKSIGLWNPKRRGKIRIAKAA
jgi:hypothetical protein